MKGQSCFRPLLRPAQSTPKWVRAALGCRRCSPHRVHHARVYMYRQSNVHESTATVKHVICQVNVTEKNRYYTDANASSDQFCFQIAGMSARSCLAAAFPKLRGTDVVPVSNSGWMPPPLWVVGSVCRPGGTAKPTRKAYIQTLQR